MRLPHATAALALLLTTGACHADKKETVRWDLRVTNVAGEPFGVRIFLDGQSVFEQPNATASSQGTVIEDEYSLGEHVVEFEIVAPRQSPSTYVATVEYAVRGGAVAHADGVPASLRAGERLTMVLTLDDSALP